MKTPFALIVLVLALFLGACADQPLISDEDYKASHGPAPNSPDPSSHVSQSPLSNY
jgi:hypothetical protein